MTIKFKRRRRLFIKILSILVALFFVFSTINIITNDTHILTFGSLLLQVLLWFGMLYYQAARYDDEKIVAQFGWPRIRYSEIVSVKSKWDGIIIKSDKREIVINKESVDQESLEKFIEHLDQKTPKPINKTLLL